MSDLEGSEINFFNNWLNEIEVFKNFHEVSEKLESFLSVLRPRGERTTKLYENVRKYANNLRRVQDALFIYVGDVTWFADETLKGIESLNEENCEEFIEDTIEGIDDLCKRFDDSSEKYYETQNILVSFKNEAEHLSKDMRNVGIAATLTEFVPHTEAVRHILNAIPNCKALSFLPKMSNIAPWFCGCVPAAIAVGYAAGKAVPSDNPLVQTGAGAGAAVAVIALSYMLVTVACPQLNACVTVASAVSALLAFDYRSEMIAVVQCIDKVDSSITDHRETISMLKKHVDRAVNKGDKLRNRGTNDEGNPDRIKTIRRRLKQLESALRAIRRDVQQKFGNNRQAMVPSKN